MTLKEIWDKYSRLDLSYLIVTDQKGTRVFIQGYREPDSDGGCMAQGEPGCLYGKTEDGKSWWNAPAGRDENVAEWIFVRGYEEKFYVREFETGRVFRGIERGEGGGFEIIHGRSHVYVSGRHYEEISEGSICLCCLKDLNPVKKGFFGLFNGKDKKAG